jgi:hypothetical protein
MRDVGAVIAASVTRRRSDDRQEDRHMTTTRQLPRTDWSEYFARFTHERGARSGKETVTIEVLSSEIGDQIEAREVPLVGITYDPRSNALDVLLKGVEHLAYEPSDIWLVEQDDGTLRTIEVVRGDGSKELVHIRRQGD